MLLVIPPNYTSTFSYPFLGIMYLASVLKSEGLDVRIFDCQTTPRFRDRILLEAEKHDTVGFYVNFFTAEDVNNMAADIRRVHPATRIIVGGPYPNYNPEMFLRSYADIVVMGEGEEAIKAIASGEDLSRIQSLVYRTPEGEIVSTPRRPGWTDIENLPFPLWDLVNYRKYSCPINRNRPVVSIQSSRGCPFGCIYCTTKLIHGYNVRMRSPEHVVDELEYDHTRFGIREVQFMDDCMTVSVTRTKKICEEIIRRGLHRRLRLAVPIGIRPDIGDREMFQLMARAGFYYVALAVESANPHVSDSLNRGVNLDKVPAMIEAAKDAGLVVSTFWIFGSPFDTRATLQDSVDFILHSKSNMISIAFLVPFPGTKLYDMFQGDGSVDLEKYEETYSFISKNPIFQANDWTREDLLKLTKRTFRRFYLSPRRILMNVFNLSLVHATIRSLPRIIFNLFFHGRPTYSGKKAAIDL